MQPGADEFKDVPWKLDPRNAYVALANEVQVIDGHWGETFPLVAYGNIGFVDEEQGWNNTDSTSPEGYLQHVQTWPAQIIGACCGSTPDHIRKLKQCLVP